MLLFNMERTRRRPTLTKVILKTSAITLFFAFVVFSYGLVAFGWVFPKVMADFSVTLGAHNAAGMYFEREWDRSQNSKYLYFALDRYIIANNSAKIAELGETFLGHDDFDEIITEVNKQWTERAKDETGKIDIINQVSWANESSRIKTAYTVALIRTGKTDKAFVQLDAWLLVTPQVDQPNHAFISAFRLDETAKARLENYIVELEKLTGVLESPFALDFLWEAHARLGNTGQAQSYAGLFYDLLGGSQ
jgi:hypothetical protein